MPNSAWRFCRKCALVLTLTLEILNGVFEGDAVALEEGVQIVPRWDVEELAHLDPSHPVRPVRFRGKRFHGRPSSFPPRQ